MGLSKPVHVLQRGSTVEEIIDVAAIAVVDAQRNVKHSSVPLSKFSAA
jgi:malate dehydrogenase (oxaloacetate-decarboxylating)(NADP+)